MEAVLLGDAFGPLGSAFTFAKGGEATLVGVAPLTPAGVPPPLAGGVAVAIARGDTTP